MCKCHRCVPYCHKCLIPAKCLIPVARTTFRMSRTPCGGHNVDATQTLVQTKAAKDTQLPTCCLLLIPTCGMQKLTMRRTWARAAGRTEDVKATADILMSYLMEQVNDGERKCGLVQIRECSPIYALLDVPTHVQTTRPILLDGSRPISTGAASAP
jgi:hypothetical protein